MPDIFPGIFLAASSSCSSRTDVSWSNIFLLGRRQNRLTAKKGRRFHFAVWKNIFSNFDKSICQFGQIHLVLLRNEFWSLEWYILKYRKIFFLIWTHTAGPISSYQGGGRTVWQKISFSSPRSNPVVKSGGTFQFFTGVDVDADGWTPRVQYCEFSLTLSGQFYTLSTFHFKPFTTNMHEFLIINFEW